MTGPSAEGRAPPGDDPALRVPELPSLTRPLGSLAFPVQRAGRIDDDATYTLTGASARVVGGHARGLDEALAGPLLLLSRLRLEGAVPRSSMLSPLGLERRLDLEGAGVVERSVVPQSDPVCFFEWVSDAPAPVTISWRVPAPPGQDEAPAGIRWRRTERGLLVETGAGRVLYVLSRSPEVLEVSSGASDDDGHGALRARARLEPGEGGAVRLVVAGLAAGADEERVLRVMGRGHVVVPTRRAEAQRVVDERLWVAAPDASLGEALAWSKLRLAAPGAPLRRSPDALAARDVRVLAAALATGDPAPARALLTAAEAGQDAPSDAAAEADPQTAARHLIVTARYLAWTGDLRTVKGAWEGVRARAGSCLEALTTGTLAAREGEMVVGALRELVVVAEEAGDAPLADRLKATVRERPAEDAAARNRAAAGPEGGRDPLLRSAALVEAVVDGLLGADPDAPRGRLGLRPRLPASWASFAVRNLTMGAVAVELEYDRMGGRHGFTLRQVRGATPVRVILEPELEGQRLMAARVDGEAAGLDPVAVAGRLRLPIQLVLDHERRLEVEIEAPDA